MTSERWSAGEIPCTHRLTRFYFAEIFILGFNNQLLNMSGQPRQTGTADLYI